MEMNGSQTSSPRVSRHISSNVFINNRLSGDRNLINYAPSTTLHRLRKAELVRLWKVAGMWDNEDIPDDTNEDEMAGDMGKKELVDGLIAVVCPSLESFCLLH